MSADQIRKKMFHKTRREMVEIVRDRVFRTWDVQFREITINQMIEIILDVIGVVDSARAPNYLTANGIYEKLWGPWGKQEPGRLTVPKFDIFDCGGGNWPGLDNIPEIFSFLGPRGTCYRARLVKGLDVIGVVGRNPGLNTLQICKMLNGSDFIDAEAVNDILPNHNITEKTDRWPGLDRIPEIYMDQYGHFYLWNAYALRSVDKDGVLKDSVRVHYATSTVGERGGVAVSAQTWPRQRMVNMVRRRLRETWDSQLNPTSPLAGLNMDQILDHTNPLAGLNIDQMVDIILDVIGIVAKFGPLTGRQIHRTKILPKSIESDFPHRAGNWPGLDSILQILGNSEYGETVYRSRHVEGLDVIGVVGRNPGLNTLQICVLLKNRNLPNTSSAAVNDILPNHDITEITDRWPGLEGIPEIYMNQEGLFYLWNAENERNRLPASGRPPGSQK